VSQPPQTATVDGTESGDDVAVQLNHTLVNVRDKQESAAFVAEVLGLAGPKPYGPFLVVQVDNDVSLDFIDVEVLHPQHYAFLVSDAEFDEILDRIRARGLTFWADPFKQSAGSWNTDDGGRGLYWEEPSGHLLEIITRPYGSGA
jgi:catechol 2,3-dioxygenase-like lactoylglutathione lyase family enzyme